MKKFSIIICLIFSLYMFTACSDSGDAEVATEKTTETTNVAEETTSNVNFNEIEMRDVTVTLEQSWKEVMGEDRENLAHEYATEAAEFAAKENSETNDFFLMIRYLGSPGSSPGYDIYDNLDSDAITGWSVYDKYDIGEEISVFKLKKSGRQEYKFIAMLYVDQLWYSIELDSKNKESLEKEGDSIVNGISISESEY